MLNKCNSCCLLRANLLFYALVFSGVLAAAVDANWTQNFLSSEVFMTYVFPLAALLLFIGVIVLSQLKESCDMN